MSIKELSEAIKSNTLKFGLKEILKRSKDKRKKFTKIFVAKDARSETIEKLQKNEINFEFSKTKKEISDKLELNFQSEVFFIE